MSQSHRLRIIIPACNESARIAPTIEDFCSTFAERATILIVANGCDDGTPDLVRQLQARHANLRLIEIPGRIGKGGAVRVGFCTGNEPVVGFVDADGSTSAAEFDRLFRLLEVRGVDSVIGSRWVRGARIEPKQPLSRRVASRVFNLMARMFFGLPFADTQCGAKLFSRRAIAEVLHSLEAANFAFDIEVLCRLRRAGFSIAEEPTQWSDQKNGTKVQLARASWAMFTSLVRMKLRGSALWFLPFVDRIGRASVIGVVEKHRVLLVGQNVAQARLDERYAALFAELEKRGFHVTDLLNEVDRPWQRRLCARRDALGAFATIYWYATRSHRAYDGILEIAGGASLIPALTEKPSVVVGNGARPTKLQRALYARSTFLNFDSVSPLEAAETIAYLQTAGFQGAGVFIKKPVSLDEALPMQDPESPHLQLVHR